MSSWRNSPPSKQVQELCELTDAALVARLTNGCLEEVAAWIAGREQPTSLQLTQLETAREILDDVARRSSANLALLWFVSHIMPGVNLSPLLAIQRGHFWDARLAANYKMNHPQEE